MGSTPSACCEADEKARQYGVQDDEQPVQVTLIDENLVRRPLTQSRSPAPSNNDQRFAASRSFCSCQTICAKDAQEACKQQEGGEIWLDTTESIPAKPKAKPKAKRKLKEKKGDVAKPSKQNVAHGDNNLGLAVSPRPTPSSQSGVPSSMSTEAASSDYYGNILIEPFPEEAHEISIPLHTYSAPVIPPQKSGWLLKKKGTHRPMPLARLSTGSVAGSMFWKMCYFDLRRELLTYAEDESSIDNPIGAFKLAEIDGVFMHGKEILLHFVTRQCTGNKMRSREQLCLRASTAEEAESWGEALRLAAAAQLQTQLPKEWDVKTMLSESVQDNKTVNLVSEVPLPEACVLAAQRLADHAFICKRTRDRGDHEVPVRLEVEKVVRVQNSAAWIKYSKARDALRREYEPLVPPVLTSTHEDSIVARALGELDAESNEHWLWHGTSSAGVQGIAQRDFRLDLAGSHRGTMYGKGVYLAECSSKADEYAYEEDGLCRMLLCRAALGRILVEQQARPEISQLQSRCKAGYDSLCGDRWAAVGTYREFILYNQGLVYPAYIVYYRRIGQAELLQAIGVAADQRNYSVAARLIAHAARLAETHPDQVVRYRISMLLAARTPLVVPALTDALKDDRRPLRRTAAIALGKLGAHTTPAVAGLAEASALCKAVASFSVPKLAESMKDESEDVRKACAVALQQFGLHAVQAVPDLTAALGDSSPGVRMEAAVCLGHLGSYGAQAVPALTAQLKDGSSGARRAAAVALGSLCHAREGAKQAAAAVVGLTHCLADSSDEVREAAAHALGKFGASSATAPALDALTNCLKDDTAAVRQASAFTLGQIGSAAASSIDQLVECLQDDTSTVRSAAASALGGFGAKAAPAIQKLKQALKDPDAAVCCAACLALGEVAAHPSCTPKAATAVHALARCLKESDPSVRKASAQALGMFAAHAAPALPALTERIKDSSPDVRKAAATALCQLGEHAAPAVAALSEFLNDPNEDVRRKAGSALADIERRLSSAEQAYAAGDRVQALFTVDNTWYRCAIRKVYSDGTYQIDWDDGDTEDRKKTSAELRKDITEENLDGNFGFLSYYKFAARPVEDPCEELSCYSWNSEEGIYSGDGYAE